MLEETLKEFQERIKDLNYVQLIGELELQSASCKDDLHTSFAGQQESDEKIRKSYEPFISELKRRIKEYHWILKIVNLKN